MTTTLPATSQAGTSSHRASSMLTLAGFILVCQAAGLLGTLFGNTGFYRELQQPAWAPPAAIFGPVWIVLYTLMGVAGWLVWRAPASPARRLALTLFAVQLVLNAMWTPIFFGLENIALALVVILAMVLTIAATTARLWKVSRPASFLFVPYLAWVGFAAALNFALWQLNG